MTNGKPFILLDPTPNAGYTACPCCGYDTISDDMSNPELCSECIEFGCDEDGEEPQ